MPLAPADLLSAAYNDADRTIDLRRRIHRQPEIGLDLPRTQATVLEALGDLPVELTTGTRVSSVVGVLRGARPGPTYLLRADMDALPVQEDSGLPFASEVPGVMHACGHDTHVAMLVGAARLLAERRDEIAGQVVLMLQPGEEGFHGARYMLEEGLLDAVPEAPVAGAFAMHVISTFASGSVHVRPGPTMAAADHWSVTVRGRGGHASMPHAAADPIPVAAEIVLALQSMVTRRVDPGGHPAHDGRHAGHARCDDRLLDGVRVPVLSSADHHDRQRAPGREAQRARPGSQGLLVQCRAAQQVLQQGALRLQFRPDGVVAEESSDRQRVRGMLQDQPQRLGRVVTERPPRHDQPTPAAGARADRGGRPPLGSVRRRVRHHRYLTRARRPVLQERRRTDVTGRRTAPGGRGPRARSDDR